MSGAWILIYRIYWAIVSMITCISSALECCQSVLRNFACQVSSLKSFYVDKCSVSCSIYEMFSPSSLESASKVKFKGGGVIHYLGDFMDRTNINDCKMLMPLLIELFEFFGIPIAPEKTTNQCTYYFLCLCIDTLSRPFSVQMIELQIFSKKLIILQVVKRSLLAFLVKVLPSGAASSCRVDVALAGEYLKSCCFIF